MTNWLLTLIFFLGSVRVLASDLPAAFTQALVALETNNCPAVLQAFEAIPHPRPKAIGQRVRFLTGYCLLQTDRPAEALPFLEQAGADDNLLADYALSYAAQAALALEDQSKTAALLSRLLVRYPKSRLAEDAQFRLATTTVYI